MAQYHRLCSACENAKLRCCDYMSLRCTHGPLFVSELETTLQKIELPSENKTGLKKKRLDLSKYSTEKKEAEVIGDMDRLYAEEARERDEEEAAEEAKLCQKILEEEWQRTRYSVAPPASWRPQRVFSPSWYALEAAARESEMAMQSQDSSQGDQCCREVVDLDDGGGVSLESASSAEVRSSTADEPLKAKPIIVVTDWEATR